MKRLAIMASLVLSSAIGAKASAMCAYTQAVKDIQNASTPAAKHAAELRAQALINSVNPPAPPTVHSGNATT